MVPAVVAVQFDEKKAVSGSADGDVRVWSLMTGECTHVLSSGQADMEVVSTRTDPHLVSLAT